MNHAIQRAQERYGLTLTVADVLQIQRQICVGEALMIKGHPGQDVAAYAAKIRGATVLVVAERRTGQVRTFLPPTATQISRQQRRKWFRDNGRQAQRRG